MFKKFVFSKLFLFCSFIFIIVFSSYRFKTRQKYYTLIADIKKIDELKIGAKVTLSGVDIGEVSKLELAPDFSVHVIMKIKKEIEIPDDSLIAIYTDGLFGSKYISVLAGGSLNYLKDGDSFEFAQGSIDITEMISLGIKNFKTSQEKVKNCDGKK